MNTASHNRPSATELYHQWLAADDIDKKTKEELRSIEGQQAEIEDRFYKDLEFGTGGLRGVMGAGTNRLNTYTIRRATQGLAQAIHRGVMGASKSTPSVAIAYDSRHRSPEFALEAALTLAANGIRAYVFDSLRPTPELSFAVRELGAQAGIVITASHNPPEYNGYKVYGPDGGQIIPDVAEQIIDAIQRVRGFADAKTIDLEQAQEQGLLQRLGESMDSLYIAALKSVVLRPEAIRAAKNLTIVYTPLHGAGNQSVQRILQEVGFSRVLVVPEQEFPDPEFSFVQSPNPEEREAFDLAIRLAQREMADLIIGTDPDCDRVGVVVRNHEGTYEVLTGNQTGALLLHYILSTRQQLGTLQHGATLVKTIVTSQMGRAIAADFGVETIDTLTGFKYIGEQIRLFEQQARWFVFGYEESYGYLAADFVRDKDGVMATMLICEMAAYYHTQGMTLYDALLKLYEQYGWYRETLVSKTLKGIDGLAQISAIMEHWRSHPPVVVAGVTVVEHRDYLNDVTGLPRENVLYYTLADGSWFCLRPSGTEPKIKFYVASQGNTQAESDAKLEQLTTEILARVQKYISEKK